MYHHHYLRKGIALEPPLLFVQQHLIGTRCLNTLQLWHVAERILLNVSFILKLQHGGTPCHLACFMILGLSLAICLST